MQNDPQDFSVASAQTVTASTARGNAAAALSHQGPTPIRGNPFVPLLLMVISLAVWFVTLAIQHWSEHQQLASAKSGLDVPEQNAKKLRTALDAVASATAKLGDAGNANAKVIVEELRKRGITINPSATSSTP